MLEILDTVEQWLKENRKVSLATVVETWGSAPRRVGAKMAVTQDMAMVGSVSGGCVEGAVIEEAVAGLSDGQPRLLNFGVSDDTAWDVGLTCGGRISIFVEPLDSEWWAAAAERIRADSAAATVTVLHGEHAGQKLLVDESDAVCFASADLKPEIRGMLQEAARQYRHSQRASMDGLSVMIDRYRPRPRLILIGGVHVAMPLQQMARQLGFRVSLIDPRQAFATRERFPDVEAIYHSYPDKALREIGLNEETYIAVLTHDPKIDDPALRTALPSDAPYVGVLSSKRTHEERVRRLAEAGVNPDHIARIRTPIGIDIGAQTPEEIALCIMAEIVAVRNRVMA